MPAISQSEYDKYLKQIQDIQKKVDSISASQKPSGQVAGASTSLPPGLNAAQIGGASGVGFEAPATQEVISGQVQNASEQGLSKSQAGSSTPQTFSSAQANYAVRGAGLSGLVDPNKYVGLAPEEAQKRIQEEKAKRLGQVSQNTSFAFNPETLSGTKKIVDRVGIGINDITNDPFASKNTQTDQIKSVLESSAREIASLFNSQEEFNTALQANPQLQKTIEGYQALGGKSEDIASKIQIPNQTNSPQSTSDYLANLTNPQANREAEQLAISELFPERAIIQEEIARQNSIPQEMIDLYFGTEEQIGLLEMKKNQAIEEKKIIEAKELNDKNTLKDKARLALEKGKAELKIQTTKIEENRLAAKNYMTGMLAKLGALKTTGAAPQALQTIETKYQIQTQTLENDYKFAERELDIQLNEALNNVETTADEEILKLEQDLTKDYEDISKEIMKLQQSAERETYNLTIKYATKLRERTTAYTKQLQTEAEKYAKEFAKIAGGGIDLFSLAQTTSGTLGRSSLNQKKNQTAVQSSYQTVKTDIRKNLPNAIATKIITELTDEQMALFLDDYLQARVDRQQSFDPVNFFEDWKRTNSIKQDKKDDEEDYSIV